MPKQAGRSTFPATSALSVLAVLKFDVKLPFRRAQVEPVYSIDACLCGLLKESPMVLPVLFSKGCYSFSNEGMIDGKSSQTDC
jgi:hypothetical protein